ncbi:MAG TPA: hypothetical protein DCQ84_01935, partial [Candidatus Competibacteraceae bacterium]|nr:hypothetical protein [Candidatus Competibacteraceae bacterium]
PFPSPPLSRSRRQSRARAEAARREAAGHTTAVETLRARLEAVRQALERLDAQRQQLRLRAGRLDQ